MELTGFMDSPWSGSSFTFPSKSLVSKFTILYLMLFRETLLSQDLIKKKTHFSLKQSCFQSIALSFYAFLTVA